MEDVNSLPDCSTQYYQLKKHVCRKCDYRSVWRSAVRRHEKAVHKIEEPETERQGRVVSSSPSSSSNQLPSQDDKEIYSIFLEPYYKLFVCGPSKSGKTHLVAQLLINESTFSARPSKKIIYVFQYWQAKLAEIKQLNLVDIFLQGGEELKSRLSEFISTDCLIIFDDQMHSRSSLEYISELFTGEARHNKMSLIYICQRIFHDKAEQRIIRDNSDYFCLFKNPKGGQSIKILSTQMTGDSTLADVYHAATSLSPHSYILVDCRQQANNTTKYLTNLFTRNHVVTAFVVKMNSYKRSTTFDKMYLISAHVLDNLNIPASVEYQTPPPIIEPEREAEKVVAEKRKFSDEDEEDEYGKRQKLSNQSEDPPLPPSSSSSSSLPTSPPSPPPPPPPLPPSPPSESISPDGTRDLGLGMDTDAETAQQISETSQPDQPIEISQNTQISTPPAQADAAFPNTCEICNRNFRTQKGLNVHKSLVHLKHKKNSVVETNTFGIDQVNPAGDKPLSQYEVEDLSRKKSNENKSGHCVCKICNKHFSSKRLYNKHVQEEHINVDAMDIDNVLEEEEGDRQRRNRKRAKSNQEILKNQSSTKIARKKFTQKKNIQKAANSLINVNLVECNLCNESFSDNKKLKDHFLKKHRI